MNKKQTSLEELENEVVSLKIRVRRLEDFVRGMPQADDYLSAADEELSDNDLFEEAKRLLMGYDYASASLLQRRMSLGYSRAGRLLDRLEDAGIVEQSEGAKPRKVVKSKL